MKASTTSPSLSRHLPITTNRTEFKHPRLPPLPIITQRIDFAGMWAYGNQADDPISQDVEREPSTSPAKDIEMSPDPVEHVSGESEISADYDEEEEEDELDDDETSHIDSRKIPKPQGEPGRPRSGGYSLSKVLKCWGDDLKTITMFVKQKADETLDTTQCYKKQPAARIAAICELTTARFPILDKYDNTWPVRDILKAHIKYKNARRDTKPKGLRRK